MSDSASDLDRALRRLHRSVLVTLGACALVIAAGAATETADEGRAPPAPYVTAALALALVSIVARGPLRRGPRGRPAVYGTLVSLLAAGGVGVVGAVLAFSEGLWRPALLYTVGGLILAIRPPPRFAAGREDPTQRT